MKNFGKILLGLAVLAAIVSSARANQVTVTKIVGYEWGTGGEFSLSFVNPVDPAIKLNDYDAKAMVAVPGDGTYYESFCLEENEGIPIPGTYNYVVNSGAVAGGVGGAVNGIDPISIGTAYLYSQFAAGTLSGYDYTRPPGGSRSQSAGTLQVAIWWLEDEQAIANPLSNPFISMVDTMFSGQEKADNNGALPVAALNLTDDAGNLIQDQLVMVPDGGLTVALLGMAFIGLLALKRRFLA